MAFFHCFFDTAYFVSWRKYVTLLIRVLRDSLKNCLLNLKSSGTDLISGGKFRSNVLSVKAWKDKHYEERLGTSIKRGMWTFIREVLRKAKFTPNICQAYGNSKEFQSLNYVQFEHFFLFSAKGNLTLIILTKQFFDCNFLHQVHLSFR